MMKALSYNILYYKNYLECKIVPNYVVNNFTYLHFTPKKIPQPLFETEFEKATKHNILKIPTVGYKERLAKFFENNKETKGLKISRIPELPSEITILEFLPEDNIERRLYTIICIHGWEGRGTNFYKFIKKLIKKGFRVLAVDFPMHGNTGGLETGCHAFGFALNCILNYIKESVILLVHSLGNYATCINYYISDEKTRNQIKGFVGMGSPDKYTDLALTLGRKSGLDDYANNLFLKKISEILGFDTHSLTISSAIKYYNFPCLLVHDDKDKEIYFDWGFNVSKHIPQKFQTYKIGDREYPCFHRTSGLGHRRILRDDNVVNIVVDFISNIKS